MTTLTMTFVMQMV